MRAVWLLFLIPCVVMAEAGRNLSIQSLVQVSAQKPIYLADIVNSDGWSNEQLNLLKKIKVVEGPGTGEKVIISGAEISQAIREMKKPGLEPVQVNIPSKITIVNRGQKWSRENVLAELEVKWKKQCDCRVQVEEVRLPLVRENMQTHYWQVKFPESLPRSTFVLPVEFYDDNQELVQRLWLRGNVNFYKTAAVTTRALQIGERLQSEDFVIKETQVTFLNDTLANTDLLVGSKVKLALGAQQVVVQGALEKEKTVRRGDPVKISMGAEAWEVSIMGISEQDGYIGDTIRVRNTKSQALIQARIIKSGEVLVQ